MPVNIDRRELKLLVRIFNDAAAPINAVATDESGNIAVPSERQARDQRLAGWHRPGGRPVGRYCVVSQWSMQSGTVPSVTLYWTVSPLTTASWHSCCCCYCCYETPVLTSITPVATSAEQLRHCYPCKCRRNNLWQKNITKMRFIIKVH